MMLMLSLRRVFFSQLNAMSRTCKYKLMNELKERPLYSEEYKKNDSIRTFFLILVHRIHSLSYPKCVFVIW